MDAGADEQSTVRGGTSRGALRGKRGGRDKTSVVASGGAPLVAGGMRVKIGMGGLVSVWPHEGGGGASREACSSWGPRTRARKVGRRQPGDGGVGSRARRQGKREKGERRGRLAGRMAHGVGPVC
jgi:hypothetical protein